MTNLDAHWTGDACHASGWKTSRLGRQHRWTCWEFTCDECGLRRVQWNQDDELPYHSLALREPPGHLVVGPRVDAGVF